MCVGMDASKYNPIVKVFGDKAKFADPASGFVQKLEKKTQDRQQAQFNAQAPSPSYATGSTVLASPAPKAGGSTYLGSSS